MSKNTKIIIKNRKCAFPSLSEPKAFTEGQEGKYSIKLLIDKNDKDFVKTFKEWVKDQIDSTDWAEKTKKQVLKSSFTYELETGYNDNCVLKDGDLINQRRVDEDKEPYDFYNGHYVISANRKGSFGPPLTVGRDAQPIEPSMIAAEIVGGYWVNAQIGSFCYSKPKQGISIQLLSVQKVKADTAFGQNNPFEAMEALEDDVNDSDDGNPFE